MRAQSQCFTSRGGNTSLKKLKDHILPLFLTCPMNDDDEEPVILRGLGAAKALLRAARDAHASDEVNLGHIQELCVYDWIFSQEENEEVQSWLKSIWIAAGVAGASAVSKSSARQSSSSNEMLGGPATKKEQEEEGSLARRCSECCQFVCACTWCAFSLSCRRWA